MISVLPIKTLLADPARVDPYQTPLPAAVPEDEVRVGGGGGLINLLRAAGASNNGDMLTVVDSKRRMRRASLVYY